jgi:hypothetical protein
MGLLSNFDINNNFWKINPQLTLLGAFKKLYDSDKSKDKINSSHIMWGIGLVYDPESKYYNIPLDYRRKLVVVDYFKQEKFGWAIYNDVIDFYIECCLTTAERSLAEWNNKMTERSEFINSTKYSIGTVNAKTGSFVGSTIQIIDNMLANTKKLYDDYKRIMEDLGKEQMKTNVKGGTQKSASESGMI